MSSSQPTVGAFFAPLLTDISILHKQNATNFKAEDIFPAVPSHTKFGHYKEYDKDDWFRGNAQPMAEHTEPVGATFDFDYDSRFDCTVKSIKCDISELTKAQDEGLNMAVVGDDPFTLDRAATELVTTNLLITRENDFASKYFTTGVWTGSSTGGDITPVNLWDNYATSDPIKDIRNEIEAFHRKNGWMPTDLTFPLKVWNVLKDHPSILSRNPVDIVQVVDEALIAKLLEIKRVHVAKAVHNTAPKGATAVYQSIFQEDAALLTYAPDTPSKLTPSAGYIFAWTGYTGATEDGMRILQYMTTHNGISTRIQGDIAYDQKLVGSELGVFFTGVIA